MVKSSAIERPILDPAFARRLNQACDTHPMVPALNHGRLTWVQRQLQARYDEKVSLETVRKWFAGETRPRPAKMKLLAALVEADEAWLSLGSAPDMQPRERRAHNAAVNGAVNVLAGFIELSGGRPAFPQDNDPRAGSVDLYAIIRGAQYAFKVVLASTSGANVKLSVPNGADDALVVAVVPHATGFAVDFIEVEPSRIEKSGARKGGHHEITLKRTSAGYEFNGEPWRVIESFADRL